MRLTVRATNVGVILWYKLYCILKTQIPTLQVVYCILMYISFATQHFLITDINQQLNKIERPQVFIDKSQLSPSKFSNLSEHISSHSCPNQDSIRDKLKSSLKSFNSNSQIICKCFRSKCWPWHGIWRFSFQSYVHDCSCSVFSPRQNFMLSSHFVT